MDYEPGNKSATKIYPAGRPSGRASAPPAPRRTRMYEPSPRNSNGMSSVRCAYVAGQGRTKRLAFPRCSAPFFHPPARSFVGSPGKGTSKKVALPKSRLTCFQALTNSFIHSFALFCTPKMAKPLFSIVCALFGQKHPGWGWRSHPEPKSTASRASAVRKYPS